MYIKNTKDYKLCTSKKYNSFLLKSNGFFARWGRDIEDDPVMCPFGPEILDMEISRGGCSADCAFCYKDNGYGSTVKHMDFDTFTKIFSRLPKSLTQIAFGITDIGANPDLFRIMQYARDHGVMPNYTCNGHGVTEKYAELTAKTCGAVSVSIVNKGKSFDAIQKFIHAGTCQVNIHYMLSEETYDGIPDILDHIKNDLRLIGLKAIIFLQYKPKGSGASEYHSILYPKKFENIIKMCDDLEVPYGFDSCSAPLFFTGIQNHPRRDTLAKSAEPCESGLFSLYCNVDGEYFPCSFTEGSTGWETGLPWDAEFLKEIWMNKRLVDWREGLLITSKDCHCFFSGICRSCPVYPGVTACKKVDV